MQDLIDSNHLLIGGVNDQGDNFVAPPNQNLQIFTNPMPKHSISFVKASETKNEVMNVNMDDEIKKDENMDKKVKVVSFIKAKPRKGSTKMPLDIDFSQKLHKQTCTQWSSMHRWKNQWQTY